MDYRKEEIIIKLILRAWNEKLKTYTYSCKYKDIKDFFEEIHGHDVVFEFFTGSKDRDGTEIYDGDLCEYSKSYSIDPEIEIVKVYWEKRTNGFRIKGNKTNSYGKKSSSITGSMLKVKGNIHQGIFV